MAEGQPVTVRLEARADFDLTGQGVAHRPNRAQRSWRTPVKGYRVEIALERTDPTFMRPAMRFRGEIETGRIPGLLLVPREAVFLRDDGPVVWARRALGWREVRVKLGRSNRTPGRGRLGPREGDRVSPLDLAQARGPATPRRARRARDEGAASRVLRRPRVLACCRRRARAAGVVGARSRARLDAGPRRDLRGAARPLRARGRGPRHAEGGQGHPASWRRCESGRSQKVAFLAKDGPLLKAGDDGRRVRPLRRAEREAADGQADLAAAHAKIDKAKAEGGKNERSLGPRPRRREGASSTRAETFKLTDETLYSRNQIIESRLDRDLFATQPTWPAASSHGERQALGGGARPRRDRRGEGQASSSRWREKSLLRAARRRTARRPARARAQLARRDDLRRRHALAGAEDRRAARPLAARGARCSCSRPTAAGLKPGLEGAPRDRGPARGGARGHGRRASSRSRRRATGSRRCKYFETTLSLAQTDPGVHEARPARAGGAAARRGGRCPRDAPRRGVREGRASASSTGARAAASCRSRSRSGARASRGS